MAPTPSAQSTKRTVIGAYDNRIVRWYCTIRFLIINMRILEEIEQYIPARGTTLDIGCGFGLFSLFLAAHGPGRHMVSFDRDARRIAMARAAAGRLGLGDRVAFIEADVLAYPFEGAADAAIVLDLLHHVPAAEVPRIVAQVHRMLAPGGLFIVKDIDASHPLKTAFTWLLDKAMDPRASVNYSDRHAMAELLTRAGFSVRTHQLVDILPYPHVLYICTKSTDATGTDAR